MTLKTLEPTYPLGRISKSYWDFLGKRGELEKANRGVYRNPWTAVSFFGHDFGCVVSTYCNFEENLLGSFVIGLIVLFCGHLGVGEGKPAHLLLASVV